MWIGYLVLLILKGLIGFVAMMQIIRLCIAPGFYPMIKEGRQIGENVLLNNIILLIGLCVAFLVMSKFGINILGNK